MAVLVWLRDISSGHRSMVRMNVVLASFGTDGDVLPFIGLGAHLRERGHQVALAASGHYEEMASARGMAFHELIPRAEVDNVLGDPDFWHPLKSGPKAARWGGRFIRGHYELLRGLTRAPGTVLVTNPAVLAARLLHDREQTPLVTTVLQPWMLPSVHKPPMMLGGMSFPAWGPRWLWRWYLSGLNRFGDYLMNPYLNAVRAELGLPHRTRLFDWWLSPQLILGFFSEEFGPPQPDWPAQVQLVSFPPFEGMGVDLPAEMEAFLRAGERPLVITFGTGVQHLAKLYQAAIGGCVRAGRRAIVVTKHPGQLPDELPASVIAARAAPFSTLFPRCAGVIHHGGIGTTARALAAGVPQLIIPICYDQLDNAVRVKELGGGEWMKSRQASARRIADSLEVLLRPDRPGAQPPRQRIYPDAFTRAAELIEQLR